MIGLCIKCFSSGVEGLPDIEITGGFMCFDCLENRPPKKLEQRSKFLKKMTPPDTSVELAIMKLKEKIQNG